MKTMKSTFSLALILYLCASLSGAPFVLSASAEMIPNKGNEATGLYQIKKGDTLWHLAQKYRNNPFLWPEFKNYNTFTDPDLIYPQEKLQVLRAWGFPVVGSEAAMPLAGGGDVMVDMMVPDKAELEVTKAELEVTKAELEVTKAELEDSQTKMKSIGEKWGSTADAVMDLNSQIEKLNEQNQQLQANLSEIQNTIKSNNESLRSQAKASKMAITMISSRIEDLQNELNQKVDRLQKQQGDELHMQTKWFAEELGKSDQRISEVRADISKLQADINNIKTGEWEKPNKSKRTFAILAAMAGGIAWFAVNAVGSSD